MSIQATSSERHRAYVGVRWNLRKSRILREYRRGFYWEVVLQELFVVESNYALELLTEIHFHVHMDPDAIKVDR